MDSSTWTSKALDLIMNQKMFATENGGRDDVVDIVVVFTDGRSTNGLFSKGFTAREGGRECEIQERMEESDMEREENNSKYGGKESQDGKKKRKWK